ncbi:MAG TPA: LysE family transporter [Steroidobacteraceae bacterium]|jgi:threonine/homoserine/homoserine lactone efflux protein
MYLLAAFLGVSAIIIVTPGPDTALVIRNTLLGGRASGAAAAVGVAMGQVVWALATSFGIVRLLTAFHPLFTLVKLAGAAYLLLLGAQALRAAAATSYPEDTGPPPTSGRRLTASRSLRQGLLSNLGNPKMAIFFASLLPQFAPPGRASFAALFALGAIFALMTLTWLTTYSVVVAKLGAALRRRRIRRTLEALTGSALIALGLRVAVER